MLYINNVLKRITTEYGQDESNRISQEQVVGECKGVQLETFTTYQNKEIRVVVEFPEESDKKAETEFMDMLKEIYLNKIKTESMQSDSNALESHSTDKFGDAKEKNEYE